MIVALKIIHITFAAAWFGHKILISRDVSESVRSMVGTEAFVARIKRAERLALFSGLMTLASGVALVYYTTGFADTPLLIYLGLAAVLAMFVVGAFVARPAWKTILTGLSQQDVVAASAGEPRLRQSLLLEDLLWILALATMVSA